MERLTKKSKRKDTYVSAIGSGVGCWGSIIARLAAYEDTGLTPDGVKELQAAYTGIANRTYGPLHHKIAEWVKADEDGRLAVLPFVAMVEQSLQEGKMTPQRDQCFNGRYAVVYADPKKWKLPLIDICGKRKYDKTEAEYRLEELTRQETREALREEAEHGD